MTKTSTKTSTQVHGTMNGADAAALADLAARAEQLAAEALELREQLAAVRGTREIAPPAPDVPPRHQRPAGEYATHRARKVDAPDVSTGELYERARHALADKPHTFRDLCAALGITAAGENRVKSIIVRLQRDGHPVVNLGSGTRAIWWIDVHEDDFRLRVEARGVTYGACLQ